MKAVSILMMDKDSKNPDQKVTFVYPRNRNRDILHITIFLAIALFAVALRAHLLPIPLERDEGEYAYAGKLILQGFQPYVSFYSMKMPGIYGAYALLISIFDETSTGIHLGLMIVNLATLPLIYLLGKKLFNEWVGFAASAAFTFFSVLQSVQGVSAHAEHFVVFLALGGVLLLLRAADKENPVLFFFSGLLFGLAFMMKQHGAFFAAFAGFYLLFTERRRQPFVLSRFFLKSLLFFFGLLTPFGVTCLFFLCIGSFDTFWFWTYRYAREYVSMMTPAQAFLHFKLNFVSIVLAAPLLWILAGIGLSAIYWNDTARLRSLFIGSFFIFSIMAIMPGFYFRPHYFVLILPVISLFIGIAINSIRSLLSKGPVIVKNSTPLLILLTCLLISVYQNKAFLFESGPIEASRMMNGCNPFPESVTIGKYIKDHSSKEDLIAVIGSEPQIYFYANRNAATRFIYTYPLMEKHPYSLQMQKQMAQEIELSRPKFLVFINTQYSWLVESNSHHFIFDWFRDFHQRFYSRVGVVDLTCEIMPHFYWDESSKGRSPKSRDWIEIYERTL
ncbi:MAG: ArnT family glycosyltransferase [Syntrophales bacterium]